MRSVLGSFSVRTCCEYPRRFGSVSTGDGVCCSPHCAASFSTLYIPVTLNTRWGSYLTVLILMRIATRMRDSQCFPSTRHKEINKNSLSEALPFLFLTPCDVTTLNALRYVPMARWRRPMQTTLLSDFHVYFVKVSVHIDITCGCDGL